METDTANDNLQKPEWLNMAERNRAKCNLTDDEILCKAALLGLTIAPYIFDDSYRRWIEGDNLKGIRLLGPTPELLAFRWLERNYPVVLRSKGT